MNFQKSYQEWQTKMMVEMFAGDDTESSVSALFSSQDQGKSHSLCRSNASSHCQSIPDQGENGPV